MLGSFSDVIPLWFCAEYAQAGSVSYWSSLRAVRQMAVCLWLRLTGTDPVWLEAVNAATVAGLLVTAHSWRLRAVLIMLAGLQVVAFARRCRSVVESAALRSMALAVVGVYAVVQSRLWAIECGAEQGVPLLAIGVLSLTASRSVWRGSVGTKT